MPYLYARGGYFHCEQCGAGTLDDHDPAYCEPTEAPPQVPDDVLWDGQWRSRLRRP